MALDKAVPIVDVGRMNLAGDGERRRVFVPQALGADEFLRVTWHEQRRIVVFSHWEGDHCVSAMPVRVSDIGELAELMVTALARTRPVPGSPWAPPVPHELIATDLPVAQSA